MGITKPYKFMWFGNIHGPKPYEFMGFGAMGVTKPYKFIWFGNIHGPKSYELKGFGAMGVTKPYKFIYPCSGSKPTRAPDRGCTFAAYSMLSSTASGP